MTQSSRTSSKAGIQPKEIILKLLMAADGQAMSTRDAIAACALFGLSESHVRVALVRLSGAGMIAATARGAYQRGPESAELAAEITQWRSAEARVRPWTGHWVVAHTATLGRRDRAALRVRDRALTLLGMRELERGLYLRPDNLVGGVDGVRERLYSLGLERDAAVYVASGLDDERERRARGLWDGKTLNRAYDKTRAQLDDWLARYAGLERETAARECYLLGDKAIRQLVFDPLLPDPLVDTARRAAFTQTVLRFDQAGHGLWRQMVLQPIPDRTATAAVSPLPMH